MITHYVPAGSAHRLDIEIPLGTVSVYGDLLVPPHASGLVIFAHGGGSNRRSPRNMQVARDLNLAGFGSLLFDLLTEAEAGDRNYVFDVSLLADRLQNVTAWVQHQPEVGDLPIGYFGGSTGAAVALWAAAHPDTAVSAVVSRGGRPDIALPRLQLVRVPTLLIVGGNDDEVLLLNHQAQDYLQCESQLEIVPGATHLFEEPAALEAVAELAAGWFGRHLRRRVTDEAAMDAARQRN